MRIGFSAIGVSGNQTVPCLRLTPAKRCATDPIPLHSPNPSPLRRQGPI
jgi:hypothetical protein